jgi:hypothetical protein
MLARAFYRKLRGRGLSEGEIMTAASEILGCLCDDLDCEAPAAGVDEGDHAALSG